jgi:hypothetical protein
MGMWKLLLIAMVMAGCSSLAGAQERSNDPDERCRTRSSEDSSTMSCYAASERRGDPARTEEKRREQKTRDQRRELERRELERREDGRRQDARRRH